MWMPGWGSSLRTQRHLLRIWIPKDLSSQYEGPSKEIVVPAASPTSVKGRLEANILTSFPSSPAPADKAPIGQTSVTPVWRGLDTITIPVENCICCVYIPCCLKLCDPYRDGITDLVWSVCIIFLSSSFFTWAKNRLLFGSPAPPSQVKESLSETPHPDCSRPAGWCLAWLTPPSVYECVYEWVNVRHKL